MNNSPTPVHVVSGPLTFDSVPNLYATTRDWFNAGTGMTIDLQQVTQADSAGLALLIEWLRWARTAGLSITYTNIPPQMLELIRVNGLQDTLLNGTVI